MAALAVLLCSGSLQLGWHADDYMHRAVLTRPGELPGFVQSPLDIFAFIAGDPETNLELKRQGLLPWWSSRNCAFASFAPEQPHPLDGLPSLPDSPWLMHAHSLLWLGLAVAAAAFLFRRFEPLPVAGLAALLFAVDDAHILPAMWLANRNTTISAAFGLLALIAHDRWRREGWKTGRDPGPVSFLLFAAGSRNWDCSGGLPAGLRALHRADELANPSEIRDADSSRQRWLVDCLQVHGVWRSGLRTVHRPRSGSRSLPGSRSGERTGTVMGQFGLPSDLSLFLSETGPGLSGSWTLGLVVALALVLARSLRGSNTACFWATGMLLSILPSCSTFVSDRLLFFAGLGGMGLIAAFLRGALDRSHSTAGFPSFPVRIACRGLILVHLVLAPVGLLTAPLDLEAFRDVFNRPALTFPADRKSRVNRF